MGSDLQTTAPTPRAKHHHAMELAEQAMAARREGNIESAREGFRIAAELESEAASVMVNEPTRSILHKSAASLALEAGELRMAEKLIAQALAGEPPEGIAEDLRNLLEKVHFQRHLRLEGITLSPREVQFSIAGSGVSYGTAPSDMVMTRITNVQKMLARTIQRKQNIPFKEQLKVSDNIRLYMEVPRAQSYAVTLRIGERLGDKPLLSEIDSAPAQAIDEVLECIILVNNAEFEALEKRIGNTDYYENFLGLARSLAPDGEEISVVGLTAVSESSSGINKEKIAQLDVKRETISKQVKVEKSANAEALRKENFSIRGYLRAANSIRRRHDIQLLTEDGIIFRVQVPISLMDDIVRPHWNAEVEITGTLISEKTLILEDLKPV